MAEGGRKVKDPYEEDSKVPKDEKGATDEKFTIESMFSVYDKDAGTYVDLREIMDFSEEDFKENHQVAQILKQMNETNPVQQISIPPQMKFDESEMSVSQNYYISNTKLSSLPIKSQLD